MPLRYDEDLVESTVTLCTSGRCQGVPSLQIARFHREREKLYSILDPDARNAAFFKLHLDWFREWGLEKLLSDPLKEFPLLPGALHVLAFRQARAKNDEGAELYVNESGQRSGVIALRPERFVAWPNLQRRNADLSPLQPANSEVGPSCPEPAEARTAKRDESRAPGTLAGFLHHELTHLQDMVDPAFGYVPELPVPSVSVSQHRLARERYRMLWDITIDGRLTRAGRATVATREQRAAEFSRGFSFWPEPKQQAIFESLWSASAPTHRALAELVCDPRELGSVAGPRPGAPCPLCGFPTFDWADEKQLGAAVTTAIHAEFPHWASAQGACGRCLEIYQVLGAQSPVVV